MREHPGCLLDPFRESSGEHMPFERRSGLPALWMGFTSGGLGAGGSKRLPWDGRLTLSLFCGASMFPGSLSCRRIQSGGAGGGRCRAVRKGRYNPITKSKGAFK